MLSCSMDPTTQEFVTNEILQKKEIIDTLQYISSLLEEVIANNGEIIQVKKPMGFQISKLDKQAIVLSDTPIQLSALMSRINKQVDTEKMRKLGSGKISKWLIEQGYLVKEKVSIIKFTSKLTVTDNSEDIGIILNDTVDEKTGEIKSRVLLTRQAQEYIVNNLENILSEEPTDNEEENTSQKSNYSMRGRLWSKEEEDKLVFEYVEQKLTVNEIARLHNRNYNGIRARLKKLGVEINHF